MAGEKRQCTAIKAGGGRCSLPAQPGQDTCWSHSRETAERRREYARAGGKARSRQAPSELSLIKSQLRGIASSVLTGDLDRGTAVVINQIFNSLLRSIELERRLDAQQDLMERLAELEAEVERRGQGVSRGWGTHGTGWNA